MFEEEITDNSYSWFLICASTLLRTVPFGEGESIGNACPLCSFENVDNFERHLSLLTEKQRPLYAEKD